MHASGLPISTFLNDGLLISSLGTGVPGRDRGVPLFLLEYEGAIGTVLRGVVGRESGGVGGTSPVTFARACTVRHSIFIAVSAGMEEGSHSPSAGGDGAFCVGEVMGGMTPGSAAGVGGVGGVCA